MNDKKTMKPDDKEQSELFKKVAHEHGADEASSEAADHLVGKLAQMPPERRKSTKK